MDVITYALCKGNGGGGSGGGVLVVTDTDGTLDKTWQEIHDAFVTGGAVISIEGGDSLVVVTSVGIGKGDTRLVDAVSLSYIADSASDYPTLDEDAE